MRAIVKYVVGKTYKPFLEKYLSRSRTYHYLGVHLVVPQHVFHPGFFFSTKFLWKYIAKENLNGKTFLELGAGSGLISICAAKKGAIVTATDLNEIAVNTIFTNKILNGVEIEIIYSDLFDDIPKKFFDFIAINPPYYKKEPVSIADHAWYCGENGAYFQKLFSSLAPYANKESKILMVVCDGCDLEMIHKIANENHFQLHCVFSKQRLLEKNYIFKIEFTK